MISTIQQRSVDRILSLALQKHFFFQKDINNFNILYWFAYKIIPFITISQLNGSSVLQNSLIYGAAVNNLASNNLV